MDPSINLDVPEIKTKMRISPVLSHLLTDEQDVIQNDMDINMNQDIKVNFIVELNNPLETLFYCSSLQSRLQDCRLDGCAEGGMLWIGHLSSSRWSFWYFSLYMLGRRVCVRRPRAVEYQITLESRHRMLTQFRVHPEKYVDPKLLVG